MSYVILAIAVLLAGAALMMFALWRNWRPDLRTALAVGLALRVAMWGVAAAGLVQAWDFGHDFPAAAAAVLQHQDPVLSNPGRWHILPLMPFVLAVQFKAGQILHLSWPVIGRLAPVAADLALIPLVGRLAGERRAPLARFMYACNPLSIMVCALHGQLEPVSLALGVGAFLAARRGRVSTAGILGGLSASTGGWPVLLLPGIVLTLPRWRQRIRAAACAVAVPVLLLVSSPLTVGTPVRQLPHVARLLIGARSVVGDWGWTAVATGGLEHAQTSLARPGKLVLIATLLAALYLWRRADPVDLTTALLIGFLLATPRLGVQYLMFPVPFLLARGGRPAMPAVSAVPAVLASAAWAAVGYLYVAKLHEPVWHTAHRWWALSSLVVMACLLAAMGWRQRQSTDAAVVTSSSQDSRSVPAGAGPAAAERAGPAEPTLPGPRSANST